MKKIITTFALLFVMGMMSAQGPQQPPQSGSFTPNLSAKYNGKDQPKPALRKYQILVKNIDDPVVQKSTNEKLNTQQETARNMAERGLLGDLLWKGYTSAIIQKTVNSSSNLLGFGISYVADKIKGDREKWLKKAKEQCFYQQVLSAETKIDDFYSLPSTKGAMDPENLNFEGFGCKNYIERVDSADTGVCVFYIFCKLNREEDGIRHIVNHSKFLVDIDTLYIRPEFCNLPNDSTGSSRFSFDKRENLKLQLKARLYSSWMNQATIIAKDQLLGEFTISVNVDPAKLNEKGEFIYVKNDSTYKKLVTIEGDSFIVPRSFTGTADARNYQPMWGTGQYRIEMEVSETCRVKESYYQIRQPGKGELVAAMDGTPPSNSPNSEKWKWDKAKWKAEWKEMQQVSKRKSFVQNAWNCVVESYKGTSWVATLTDPFATALYEFETTKLNKAFEDLHTKLFLDPVSTTGASSGKGGTNVVTGNAAAAGGASGQPMGGQPSGGKPEGDFPAGVKSTE